MKSLPEKVTAVKRVYARLDKEIDTLQQSSGIHCLSGCGECCKKPDIECTPLEFLPLALELFDEGRAEQAWEELQNNSQSLCYVFRPHITNFGGMCNAYPNRGLICRLFGFTARTNKEGQRELVTCKFIKQEQAEDYDQLVEDLKAGKKIPVMSEYYTRLTSIDPTLAEFYPINKAIQKALEIVMHYYSYRKRRKRKGIRK
jgi:Fe-S-cluster containining protein